MKTSSKFLDEMKGLHQIKITITIYIYICRGINIVYVLIYRICMYNNYEKCRVYILTFRIYIITRELIIVKYTRVCQVVMLCVDHVILRTAYHGNICVIKESYSANVYIYNRFVSI